MQKLKNIFIITILMITIFGVTSFADENAKVQIKANGKYKKNETYCVTLSADNLENGLFGFQGTLNYNKDIFEYLDNKVEKDDWSITGFNEETGKFMLEISDEGFYEKSSYLNSGEDFVTFNFKIKDDAKLKSTEISVEDIVLVDAKLQTIKIDKELFKIKKFNKLWICVIALVIIIALLIKRKMK